MLFWEFVCVTERGSFYLIVALTRKGFCKVIMSLCVLTGCLSSRMFTPSTRSHKRVSSRIYNVQHHLLMLSYLFIAPLTYIPLDSAAQLNQGIATIDAMIRAGNVF